MSQNINITLLLEEAASVGKTGYLQVVSNGVTWELYLIEGKLQYAHNSAQSVEVMEYHLARLGQPKLAKLVPILAQHIPDNRRFILHAANQLVTRNYLTSGQKSALMQELTKDALESLLWVTEGEYHCHSVNPFQSGSGAIAIGENLLEIRPLLVSFQTRLQAWQKLAPFITSPHQQPFCPNPSVLAQSVPSGNLAPATLQKLVQLMRGVSIRQLALVLNQDELKVAQLLLPYIKHRIIQLGSPKSSFKKLPQIPSSQADIQPINIAFTAPTPSKPPKAARKLYKIACIDDSHTILDAIKSYLGQAGYETVTIDNPMKAISSLFESKPDLILMDISMPGVNGNRLSQILRSSPVFKQTPIVLMSSNVKILNQETLKATGATDYLPKPFSAETLRLKIDKYLAEGGSKVVA